MFKKYFFLFSFLLMLLPIFVQAQSQKVQIHFFHSNSCPHCADEKLFLNDLLEEHPNLFELKSYELSDQDNRIILQSFADKLDVDVRGVPFTVIGDQYFMGFYNAETTGEQIKLTALSMIEQPEFTPPSFQMPEESTDTEMEGELIVDNNKPEEQRLDNGDDNIDLPTPMGVNLNNFSLPIITIVLGVLDGFNPCAMWALIFLISLLLGMKDKKRMWIFGSSFIVTSALVYYLFMAAWLNLILWLGFIFWLRLLIAMVAVGGGLYNIRNFFTNKDGSCKVSGSEKKKKVFDKLKDITGRQQFWLALGGIVLLAIAVNMVELVCSAGLPAVYAQVLAINNLATWQYYAYIALYVLFFMLDDLLVFFVAMTTLHMTGLSTKYARFSNIIGGTLMLLIGLALAFRPELLNFS